MRSERELFEEAFPIPANWVEYDEKLNKYHERLSKYHCSYTPNYVSSAYQARWEAWQASRNRKGYKLVHVDVLERVITHISIAMCHPNNSKFDEDMMHNDMDAIEEAMMGAIDE